MRTKDGHTIGFRSICNRNSDKCYHILPYISQIIKSYLCHAWAERVAGSNSQNCGRLYSFKKTDGIQWILKTKEPKSPGASSAIKATMNQYHIELLDTLSDEEYNDMVRIVEGIDERISAYKNKLFEQDEARIKIYDGERCVYNDFGDKRKEGIRSI